MLRSSRSFDKDDIISAFEAFCKVDLQLADRTVKDHVWQVKRFLKARRMDIKGTSKEDVRNYLMGFTNGNKNSL